MCFTGFKVVDKTSDLDCGERHGEIDTKVTNFQNKSAVAVGKVNFYRRQVNKSQIILTRPRDIIVDLVKSIEIIKSNRDSKDALLVNLPVQHAYVLLVTFMKTVHTAQ